MKIAIHNAQISYHIGGTERLIFSQIMNLLKFPNVEIHLITSKTKNPSSFYEKLKSLQDLRFIITEFDSVESLDIKEIYTSNNPNKWHLESITFGSNASSFYEDKKFDLVVTHFSTDSMFIPKKFKNVLHLHGYPSGYSEIGELALDRPDALISVSKYVRDQWIELYPKLNDKCISVVYPGIDTDKFRNMNMERENDIIFVGRFILIKGISYLLDAISSSKNIKSIILVGDGPEKSNIFKKIQELGLEDKIDVKSNISDKDLIDLYNTSKISVFPSYAKEGMGLTMLEASSCGCVPIVSNACSMPEFLKHNSNGLLFEPKNSKQLSEEIERCLLDKFFRSKLSEKAMQDIQNDWTNEKRVLELYEKYKEIVDKDEQGS
ncbi:glycosyltransferase family 4 protein [Nanoarchaeota archaeon]